MSKLLIADLCFHQIYEIYTHHKLLYIFIKYLNIIFKIIILYQIIKKILGDLSYVYPVTLTKIQFWSEIFPLPMLHICCFDFAMS